MRRVAVNDIRTVMQHFMGGTKRARSLTGTVPLTFLGPTDLTQLGCPLSESLRVVPGAVAVHLRVSRVVLARRVGLPRRPAAGRDELRDT